MLCGISEQYVDDIVTFVFNISFDLFMTNVILSMQKPQAFVSRLFWLLLIQ